MATKQNIDKASVNKKEAGAKPKISNLMEKIAEAVGRGEYLISNHAYLRSRDRLIPTAHVEHILLHGFHEQKKDSFRREFGSWNYAIRGKSPDKFNARIVVTFTEEDLFVITVINLDL